MAWSNNIFYIVFLGQILLISYYIPRKLIGRMRYVMETYPPADYPKLYSKPIEEYWKAQWGFALSYKIIMALGFVILLSVMFLVDHSTFADDGYISEAFPMAYGVIQFLPLMYIEFSEYNQLKKMRLLNASPKRRAELRHRSLFDFVSHFLLGAALFLAVASVCYDFYTHDFALIWDQDATYRSLTLIITNLALFGVGAWQLYGKKLDPHQSSGDRLRRAAASVKSLLYVSMAMSIYFMTVAADDIYNLDFLDAILMSAYFQIIVLLSIGSVMRAIRPENVDFSVYKADEAAI